MSNPFEILSWFAVFALLWGLGCYAKGYRDGKADTRLALAKPARRLAQR